MSDTTKDAVLKPCPMCGEKLEAWGVNYRHSLGNPCLIGYALVTPSDIEAWNRRAPAQVQAEGVQTQAARDVLAERQRQVNAEGWTPEHDDEHEEGELAAAAGCYAIWGWGGHAFSQAGDEPKPWPWNRTWRKPSTLRRHCVKAAALLLAEIERIDRAAPSTGDQS